MKLAFLSAQIRHFPTLTSASIRHGFHHQLLLLFPLLLIPLLSAISGCFKGSLQMTSCSPGTGDAMMVACPSRTKYIHHQFVFAKHSVRTSQHRGAPILYSGARLYGQRISDLLA